MDMAEKDKRGVGVVLIVLNHIPERGMGVLATQRAEDISEGGLWCLPCGHLEWDETGEECAVRETCEETGLMYDKHTLYLFEVDTKPTAHNQNVILRYMTLTEGTVMTGPNLSEVKDMKWVRPDELDDYKWAFGHDNVILRVFERYRLQLNFKS